MSCAVMACKRSGVRIPIAPLSGIFPSQVAWDAVSAPSRRGGCSKVANVFAQVMGFAFPKVTACVCSAHSLPARWGAWHRVDAAPGSREARYFACADLRDCWHASTLGVEPRSSVRSSLSSDAVPVRGPGRTFLILKLQGSRTGSQRSCQIERRSTAWTVAPVVSVAVRPLPSCRGPRATACPCWHASGVAAVAAVVASTAGSSRTRSPSAVCLFRSAELIGMTAFGAGARMAGWTWMLRAGRLRGRSRGRGRRDGSGVPGADLGSDGATRHPPGRPRHLAPARRGPERAGGRASCGGVPGTGADRRL
jgi:hypothetical protein